MDPPYLVDRETGEVSTADTFTDRSGEVDRFTVVAYDNRGRQPSFTATAVLTVSACVCVCTADSIVSHTLCGIRCEFLNSAIR